jgi:hypothetical protein
VRAMIAAYRASASAPVRQGCDKASFRPLMAEILRPRAWTEWSLWLKRVRCWAARASRADARNSYYFLLSWYVTPHWWFRSHVRKTLKTVERPWGGHHGTYLV